jgi:putative heme transporter
MSRTSHGSPPGGSTRSPGSAGDATSPEGLGGSSDPRSARLPVWVRPLGTLSWTIVGVTVVLIILFVLIALLSEVLIPFLVAWIVAILTVPLVDRLERWRVKRWLGAALVTLLGLGVVVGVAALIVTSIVNQAEQIGSGVDAATDEASTWLESVDLRAGTVGDVRASLGGVAGGLRGGVVGGFVNSAVAFLVGFVLALFVLMFLLKDWKTVRAWGAAHLAPEQSLGERIQDEITAVFRGYYKGMTMIAASNAAVIGLGSLILGVPLPGTIVVVTFVFAYIPYFGAFVSGAFAVILALGDGGLPLALAMLAVVILAQSTLQNLLEPFAYGRALALHPLVVLLVTTAGTILFGILGATLAAPVTAVALRVWGLLREAGMDVRERAIEAVRQASVEAEGGPLVMSDKDPVPDGGSS